MVNINVVWIRHCESCANVIKPSNLVIFEGVKIPRLEWLKIPAINKKKLAKKSIIDPLCTYNGCTVTFKSGQNLFDSLESNMGADKEYKYYCSILPRAASTMQLLLHGANKSNETIQRLFYIQEKENFKQGVKGLSANNVDFNKWKKHMSADNIRFGVDVIKRITGNLVVGSTAVINKFKSDMYKNVLNLLVGLPQINSEFKELEGEVTGDFDFIVHNSQDHSKFIELLNQMKNSEEISENTVLCIVGHGDYIKEYVLKDASNYNRNKKKTERLECCKTCGFAKEDKVYNIDAHLVSYKIKPNDLSNTTWEVKKCFPRTRTENQGKKIEKKIEKQYKHLLHQEDSEGSEVNYNFGHILNLNGFNYKMFDSKNRNLKSLQSNLSNKTYNLTKTKIVSDFIKACFDILKSVANNKTNNQSNFKMFGGKKSSKKNLILKINGKKRRIYIGPKGGKYYIKKDINNKKKESLYQIKTMNYNIFKYSFLNAFKSSFHKSLAVFFFKVVAKSALSSNCLVNSSNLRLVIVLIGIFSK